MDNNKHVNPDAIIQGLKLRYAIDASELNDARDFRKRAIEIDWVKFGQEAAVYCRAPPLDAHGWQSGNFYDVKKSENRQKSTSAQSEKPKFKEEKRMNENTDEQAFQLKVCREMLDVVKRKCMLDAEVKKYKQTGSGVCNV